MAEQQQNAVFADGGAYERYMGQRSRVTGRLLVDWLSVPEEIQWLDVGCGTGSLSSVILEHCNPTKIFGIDPSEPQVAQARNQITDERTNFRLGDATALPFDDNDFDVAVSSYVLNYVPDKQKKMDEMARVVCPGGTVAVSVFDHAGTRDPARHFWCWAREHDPEFLETEGNKMGWGITRPETLKKFFNSAGLSEIEIHAMRFEDSFLDFEDYWESMTGLPTSALSRYANSLSEADLGRFLGALAELLPTAPDGGIKYDSYAWFVRGRTA